ncbi:sensor histidine kinase [Streptomyces sp. NBC_01264]|uniref:sensor histidine kinase n=1 Tax=Streptomyces sp. NBC_01264 TaxID=2903804 RepID=UPI00225878E3|nr:ATP-binding protein [Streptomyces sp. NBC_01264]MCX4783648.1 histidine kinase [Streptomyces sp. NBC_01264]
MNSEVAVAGWGSAIGPGFAEALQQGLVRVAQRASPAPPIARQLVPRRTVHSPEGPGPEFLDAVLRRFESALPAALSTTVRWDSSVRQALNDRARTVLAAAFGTEPATGGGLSAPPVRPAPHHNAAAAVLLMECAMLQMMESGRLDEGSVRVLAEAVRQAGEGGSPVDQSVCCWQEQRRISRELHDDVADGVTAARQALEECDELPDPVAADRIAAARDALRDTDARLRDLVGGVRERSVVPPLGVALREFAAGAAPAGVQVTVKVTGDEGLLPDVRRRDLYLTLREALRNSFVHARAGRVKVSVRSTRWWAYASVEDDGRGFDVERVLRPGHSHQGFRSMAERMEDAGGRLTVSSSQGHGGQAGHGTHVEAHLPLQPHRHGARVGSAHM